MWTNFYGYRYLLHRYFGLHIHRALALRILHEQCTTHDDAYRTGHLSALDGCAHVMALRQTKAIRHSFWGRKSTSKWLCNGHCYAWGL